MYPRRFLTDYPTTIKIDGHEVSICAICGTAPEIDDQGFVGCIKCHSIRTWTIEGWNRLHIPFQQRLEYTQKLEKECNRLYDLFHDVTLTAREALE